MAFMGEDVADVDCGELLCPLCQRLANTLLPAVRLRWGQASTERPPCSQAPADSCNTAGDASFQSDGVVGCDAQPQQQQLPQVAGTSQLGALGVHLPTVRAFSGRLRSLGECHLRTHEWALHMQVRLWSRCQ
jgi:hypothetical protein